MAEASPNSMSAAAQAYQESMEKYGQREESTPAPGTTPALAPPTITTAAEDTPMVDAAPSPAPLPHSTNSTPGPQRTATPTRTTNGNVNVEGTAPMPSKAAPHGAPARRYLNEKITRVLLEGMKRLAAEQPEDPLRVLGEYLLQRSKEVEGTVAG
ncbi:COMPASS (complex proteins associated with Set1p) component [Hypocenomyce scalaris]|nr:COMPASS (complex proteins associated with Set1p) component [Hypocenomyce scalaris]